MDLEITEETEVPSKGFRGKRKSDDAYWFDRFLETLTKKLDHGRIVKLPLERVPYKQPQKKIRRLSNELLREGVYAKLTTSSDEDYIYVKKLGDGSETGFTLDLEVVDNPPELKYANDSKCRLLVEKAMQCDNWIKVDGNKAAEELNYKDMDSLYGTLQSIESIAVSRRGQRLYVKEEM